MITDIHIKNFSIIESAQVQFHDGFHVLSGETGAGKSIIMQAISFAFGARGDPESIRSGAEEATVTLCMDPSESPLTLERLEELGVSLEGGEGQLFIRRTLNAAGRSRAYLNDQPVTLKTLQVLGRSSVNLVGQHAAGQLMEEAYLLKLLDQYGSHDKELSQFQQSLSVYRDAKEKLSALKERIASSQEQEDFLRFQLNELEDAGLKDGEEAELEIQKQRLKHRVALATHSFEMIQSLIESDDSLLNRLGQALQVAEKMKSLDDSLAYLSEDLSHALEKVDSVSHRLRDYSQGLEEDPKSFDQIEERLSRICELKRKFKLDESGLIAKLSELKIQVGELEDFDGHLSEYEAKLTEAGDKLKKTATALHDKRKKAAKKISGKLEKTLKDLALPHARVNWSLSKMESLDRYRSHGPDEMTLQVSFNPGEEMRPFEEVISGGELSRLLLAMYEILFPGNLFVTFVFDEVDTGVGGGVAELIGRKISALSRQAQVLCITHLPQIACQARWHYSVEKKVDCGRTFSKIRLLDKEERVQEIARMLAGVKVTSQAIKHAQELLKSSAA